MPFIFVLVGGLFVPRVVMALLWLLTDWFSGVFTTWIIPLLGFIFMPYSMLWYTVVVNLMGGTWGPLAIIGMVLAVLLDLSSSGYSYTRYHRHGDVVVAEEVVI